MSNLFYWSFHNIARIGKEANKNIQVAFFFIFSNSHETCYLPLVAMRIDVRWVESKRKQRKYCCLYITLYIYVCFHLNCQIKTHTAMMLLRSYIFLVFIHCMSETEWIKNIYLHTLNLKNGQLRNTPLHLSDKNISLSFDQNKYLHNYIPCDSAMNA